MSVVPCVSHANKSTPCWKGSGEITDVQEAVYLARMLPIRSTINSTTTTGVLGSVSSQAVFNSASVCGWMNMNYDSSGGDAYVIDIYLTENDDGTKDGYGSIMTSITIFTSAPTINLQGLTYSNPNGVSSLYLGYSIRTKGTTQRDIVPASYSGGTCAYASQYTYSSWTMGAGVPIVVFCE